MPSYPRFLGETITLGELWNYLAREEAYAPEFVAECIAKDFETAGFSEERKPSLFSFPFTKFSPWNELLCCWFYFGGLTVRHPTSGVEIGGASFPRAMKELDAEISNAVIHRDDLFRFIQRRKLPPLTFWAVPGQNPMPIPPQEGDGRCRKSPAELLYMHEADPTTWSLKKLAREFYPGDQTNTFAAKKSWLQRTLKKARQERAKK